MEKNKTCRNCDHSHVAYGQPRPLFICSHREAFRHQWYVVDPADTCKFFRQAEFPHTAHEYPTRLIPLTQGKYALVDAADFKYLSRYKWHALKGSATYYAVRSNARKNIRMHRLITNAPKNMLVDHIDHDGLNNTRANLRICTKAQNNRNQRPRKNTTSRYKGVHYDKKAKAYYAKIKHKGKRITIGKFKNETEAAKAYDKEAKKRFGKYAYLNFDI